MSKARELIEAMICEGRKSVKFDGFIYTSTSGEIDDKALDELQIWLEKQMMKIKKNQVVYSGGTEIKIIKIDGVVGNV